MKNNKSKLSCKRGFTRNCHAELVSASTPYRAEALNKDTFRVPLRSGFTLIELLVVVLIIGILAAVAAAQYQVALLKSRTVAVLPLMKSVVQAQRIYFLETGSYANTLDALAIELPPGGTWDTAHTRVTYQDFTCFLGGAGLVSIYCKSRQPHAPQLEKYFDREESYLCWANSDDELMNKVCKAISGKTAGGTTNTSGKKSYRFGQ